MIAKGSPFTQSLSRNIFEYNQFKAAVVKVMEIQIAKDCYKN